MRVGDLVRLARHSARFGRGYESVGTDHDNVGIIIDWHTVYNKYGEPEDRYAVVNWGEKYPAEEEYPDQLEIITGLSAREWK